MNFLFNADDDWQEDGADYLYPKLHGFLTSLSEVIGIPLYAIGGVSDTQYVGRVDIDEDTLEKEFVDLGLLRNPISAYKIKKDGRRQEGSWVLWPEYDDHDLVDEGMQLHVMLFKRDDGEGRELYAHYEDDWRSRPVRYLREVNFDVEIGVEKATEIFDSWSFLTFK